MEHFEVERRAKGHDEWHLVQTIVGSQFDTLEQAESQKKAQTEMGYESRIMRCTTVREEVVS